MEVLFIAAIIAGVVALIVKATKGRQRQVEDAWQDAARQLGMSFTPGSMMRTRSIQGHLYENRVELDTFKRSSGKSSKTYTRYRVQFPEALGLGLQLKQQGFMTGVATFFGAQDIEVGDAQFDPQVVIKGNNPASVVRYLTPSRRLSILRLFQEFPGCEIKDQAIEWSRQGDTKQADELVSTVRRLSFAAKGLRENGASGREEEELGSSADEIAAAQAEPEPIEPEPTEPEVTLEQPVAEPVAATATVAVSDELDIATVCKDVFASSMMSFDAKRLFDARYKSRSVRWSGEIRRVTSYEIDMVFKGAPGTKMVLDLTEVVGAFGRTAQAIVQLPRNAIDDLRSRLGERITFEGTLLDVDVVMRNFFIVDSRLV